MNINNQRVVTIEGDNIQQQQYLRNGSRLSNGYQDMFKETNKTINKLNEQINVGLGRKQITLNKMSTEEILDEDPPLLPKRISNSTDGRA